MCFSSSASFGAAIITGTAGIACVSKIKKISELPFAAIPLIFAVQQFLEGMEWKAFHHGNLTGYAGIYCLIFLIVAQIVWPIWVPVSIFFLEEKKERKKILGLFSIMGITAGSYLGYYLFTNSYVASINTNHIHYDLYYYHDPSSVISLFYLIPIIGSPFVSGRGKMKIIGVTIGLSFLISKLFFKDDVISIWCYFAAILSVFVFLVIMDLRKRERAAGI